VTQDLQLIFSGARADSEYGQGMTTGIFFAVCFLLVGVVAFSYLKKGAM
jgi:hypothetical protein